MLPMPRIEGDLSSCYVARCLRNRVWTCLGRYAGKCFARSKEASDPRAVWGAKGTSGEKSSRRARGMAEGDEPQSSTEGGRSERKRRMAFALVYRV